MTGDRPSPLRLLILGAGAIGGYIGGSLALSGHSITFVDQPAVAAHLKAAGLRLLLLGREHKVTQAVFTSNLAEALDQGPFDGAIVAVKAYDTPTVLAAVQPHSDTFPPLLCLQNGVENESLYSSLLGESRVIAGTVTSPVGRTIDGTPILEKLRGVGIAASHPLAPRLAEAMKHAGLRPRLYTDPQGMKWSKLLTNLLANASAAILNLSPAEIYNDPFLVRLELAQLKEALHVMRKMKISVQDLPGTPVRLLALAANRLPTLLLQPILRRMIGSGRGKKMPSLHIDLYSGREKSEVEFLNGAVVRAGETVNVPTPVNRWLWQTLLALVERRLPLDRYSRQPQRVAEELGKLLL